MTARSHPIEQAPRPHAGARTRPDATAAEPCELSFGETAGLRRVTLGNGDVRAEILLDKGANVRQLWHVPSGARTLAETRDWAEQLAEFHRGGRCGNSYSDCYEGGWQDVLPARARWDGGATADDGNGVGEAAIVTTELLRAACGPAAAHVLCRARLPRCGLEVVKRFGVRQGVAALTVETTVRNPSGRDVWFSWTQHPALGGDLLDDTARVLLPGGQLRASRAGQGAGGCVTGCAGAGQPRWVDADALLPADSADDTFVTFGDVARGQAALLSGARGVGVQLRWDATVFPHAWLWCARRQPICCVAVEPSTTHLPEMNSPSAPEMLRLLPPGDSVCTWVELSTFTSGSESDAGA